MSKRGLRFSDADIRKLPQRVQEQIRSQIAHQTSHLESHPKSSPKITNALEITDKGCRIHIHSVRKRLADPDGISAKAAIDAIVVAGLLQDDNAMIVKEVFYSQEKGDTEETTITIEY